MNASGPPFHLVGEVSDLVDHLTQFCSHDQTHDFGMSGGYTVNRDGLWHKRPFRKATLVTNYGGIGVRRLRRLRDELDRHVRHAATFRKHTGPLPTSSA
jgi:hypothetical protein